MTNPIDGFREAMEKREAEMMVEALEKERDQFRQQRELLGQIAMGWVKRFYALKVANGDLIAEAMGHFIDREAREIEAACNQSRTET